MSSVLRATPVPARNQRRRTAGRRIVIWGGLAIFVVIAVVPFLYLVSESLKRSNSLFSYPPNWIPIPVYWGNFKELFTKVSFLRWTANTVGIAAVTTAIKVVIDPIAGYALAKYNFAGRRLIIVLMLATMMAPLGVLIIPLFYISQSLGILGTYWALILPALGNPIGIFMMRSYIQQLPGELESAARLDGGNPFQIWWRVILPLVRPGLVVVGMYVFLVQYTSFVWPLIATNSDPKLYLLTTGLASLIPSNSPPNYGLVSAASLLSMVPISIVFLLAQRQFVGRSTASALKQ